MITYVVGTHQKDLSEFKASMEDSSIRGKKTTFKMLLTTFNELKGKISLENVAKDLKLFVFVEVLFIAQST